VKSDTNQSTILKAESSDRFTLRGLRIFIALEEAQSFADAAQQLGLSKSSVSQHITTLEQTIGVELFDRKQKPIALTPAGQMLSQHAHRILSTVSEAEAALAELNADTIPELSIAIIDDLDASLTPLMATALQSKLPRSFIRTFSGRSDQVTERIVSRRADIAITASIPADINKFHIQELFREQFVLVVAKGCYEKTADWRTQLSDLPLIQYSESMPIGQLVITHLKRIQFSVQRRYSFETTRAVVATVAKTGGWTIATPLSILDASRFRDQVDIFPLPFTGLSRSVFLINRIHELGTLPELLADTLQGLLISELQTELHHSAPNVAGALQIISATQA